MQRFDVLTDIEMIADLLEISVDAFVLKLGLTPDMMAGLKSDKSEAFTEYRNKIYDFAFREGIRLNPIKEQLIREECMPGNIILFHGAKTSLTGELSIEKSKPVNDFGKGFYCGESMEQSAMFVAGYPGSSLYILEFDNSHLHCERFFVDREWMLAIAFFRGRLSGYAQHPFIQSIRQKVNDADYLTAPIANNRMFEIIDSFIDGEITDEQCKHCLSATNLGNQYVFKTQRAVNQIRSMEHCYLCESEKRFFLDTKVQESKIGKDKVKIARKQYRGQGKYIEEILE